MIPLPLSAAEYASYFPPAPDYIICERVVLDYTTVRGIHIPGNVQEGTKRFIGIGKVLAVSEYESDDPQVEKMKPIIRKVGYVGFEFHVCAQVVMLPQFELPRESNLICLHVKDVVYLPEKLDELIDRQRTYEAEQEKTA
jgi:hypothetical protein